MNATYDQTSPSDASQMLGVTKQTITSWCRNGVIKAYDVSESESKRPRYVIPDNELNRVYELIHKYGTRKWMLYNKPLFTEPAKEEQVIIEPEIPIPEPSKYEARFTSKADEIAKTILYIQDIKERLEDIEAERNQLTTELETLRNEVLAYIE